MLTAAICGHYRMPVGLCTHTTCIHILPSCMLHADTGSNLRVNTAALHLNIFFMRHTSTMSCKKYSGSQSMHLQSKCVCVCVCVHASTLRACVSVCASGWVINERSWIASAGHDSTTERKSFLLSPWTADSELAGIFCWLLKSHHRGAVIITPITASQQRASGDAIKKEIKVAINDTSLPVYGLRPRLWVEMWYLI